MGRLNYRKPDFIKLLTYGLSVGKRALAKSHRHLAPNWGRLLRLVPLLSVLLVVSTLLLAWRDLRQKPNATPPNQPHSSGLVVYLVTLDSFDVDTQTVRSHARVLFNRVPLKSGLSKVTSYPPPFYCQADNPFSLDLSKPTIFAGFGGRPQFFDLGKAYSQGGLRWIQDVQPLGPCDPTLPHSGFVKFTVQTEANLYAVGDPRMFPFDRYLVIYRIWCPVLVKEAGGGYLGILGFNEVDSRLAGFSMKYATPRELETWSNPSLLDLKQKQPDFEGSMWAGRQVAVVLERGLFLRVVTVLLGLVILGYLCWFGLTSRSRAWFPDVLGFFLTVWAIRGALSAGAPHVATIVDYGALSSYVGFIAVFLWKSARKRGAQNSERL